MSRCARTVDWFEHSRVSRCPRTVDWFDIDITCRCVMHAGHQGPHRDGIRWFDDIGLQVPHSPQVHQPPRGPGSGYPKAIAS